MTKQLSTLCLALALPGALMMSINDAQAQGFEATGFRPAINDSDLMDPLLSYRAERQKGGAVGINITGEYDANPLVLNPDALGGPEISQLWGTTFSVFAGVAKGFGVGVSLPVYWSETTNLGNSQVSVGDIRFALPLTIFRTSADVPRRKAKFGLALVPYAQAPTGKSNQDRYLSNGSGGGGGELVVSLEGGPIGFNISGGAGYRAARDDVNDDGGLEILSSASLIAALGKSHALGVDSRMAFNFDAEPVSNVNYPIEVTGHFRGRYRGGFNWLVGGGGGVTNGTGAPDWRVFANLGWTFGKERKLATLNVTVVDEAGNPVYGAVVDDQVSSQSTNETGQVAFKDIERGDSVLVSVTHPSGQYMTATMEEAKIPNDGAMATVQLQWRPANVTLQVVDGDQSPISGAQIEAVSSDELFSGLTSDEGSWTQEFAPGSWTFGVNADGYEYAMEDVTLEPAESRVVTVAVSRPTPDPIALRVAFPSGAAALDEGALAELDVVAQTLLDHPEIELVEIQGHSSSVGSVSSNQALSQQRAQITYDYLASKGVDVDRMQIAAYGSSCLVADDSTAEGRAANRRVSFVILQPSIQSNPCASSSAE